MSPSIRCRPLREAEARFDLTDKEKDIIVKHMWPLSPWMPRYKESFTVLHDG